MCIVNWNDATAAGSAARPSAHTSTIFQRGRTAEATITRVITLVFWSCPLVAIEHAYGRQPDTVRDWLEAAWQHAEAVHHAQIVQLRDLGQVQAPPEKCRSRASVASSGWPWP